MSRYDNCLKLTSMPDNKMSISQLSYSGDNLINEVNSISPALVIDAGCGENYFKDKINNLIGFDIVEYQNTRADLIGQIVDMQFEANSADVVLALGCLQYGSYDELVADLTKLVEWVKPGGYLIVRNFLKVDEILRPRLIDSYQWDINDVKKFSEMFNLAIVKDIVREPTIDRYVWWWKKL